MDWGHKRLRMCAQDSFQGLSLKFMRHFPVPVFAKSGTEMPISSPIPHPDITLFKAYPPQNPNFVRRIFDSAIRRPSPQNCAISLNHAITQSEFHSFWGLSPEFLDNCWHYRFFDTFSFTRSGPITIRARAGV